MSEDWVGLAESVLKAASERDSWRPMGRMIAAHYLEYVEAGIGKTEAMELCGVLLRTMIELGQKAQQRP